MIHATFFPSSFFPFFFSVKHLNTHKTQTHMTTKLLLCFAKQTQNPGSLEVNGSISLCVSRRFLSVSLPTVRVLSCFFDVFILKSMRDCGSILSTAGAPLSALFLSVVPITSSSVCKPLPVSNQNITSVKLVCVCVREGGSE